MNVCSYSCFSYLACKLHIFCPVYEYFHPGPVWLYRIFLRYLIIDTILYKKIFNMKCVF